jgi:4-amino-4-deoxychorismate lyase
MSLLFETIRLQDGVLHNLEYHNLRFNQSRKALFGIQNPAHLENEIAIPEGYMHGIYKCKLIYSKHVEDIIFEPYKPRIIKTLILIEDNTVMYNYKYLDREQLILLHAKRGKCDDILIIKDGMVTDTSFANIIFFTGTQWVTPSSPLLRGTMRGFLVKNNLVTEQEIKTSDLKQFVKARLVNAMLPFDSGNDIPIDKIRY